jgi:hypothetical protein
MQTRDISRITRQRVSTPPRTHGHTFGSENTPCDVAQMGGFDSFDAACVRRILELRRRALTGMAGYPELAALALPATPVDAR